MGLLARLARLGEDYIDKTPKYPQCINCGSVDYTLRTKPTYTVDRFSRQRISCFVDCNICGLRLRMMLGENEPNWSFKLQG